jgi:HK97 family phage prohead protease
MLFVSISPDASKVKVIEEEGPKDGANGILEGYASVFGNVDLGGDIVEKGAFAKTIKEGIKRKSILLYDSHMVYSGTDAVIGLVEDASEDDYGLKFRAKFSSVTRAQEVRTKIKEGILNALSFGFDVLKYAEEADGKIRRLLELKLYEISVVPWGMNPKAAIEAVKGAASIEDREEHFAKAVRYTLDEEKGVYIPASAVVPPPPQEDPALSVDSEEHVKSFLAFMQNEAAEMQRKQLLREMAEYSKR